MDTGRSRGRVLAMRLPVLPLVVALTLLAPALTTSGCGGSSTSTMDLSVPDNVVYVATTDEALGMLLGTAVKSGGTVALLEPTTPTYSIAAAPALRWSVGTLAVVPQRYPSFFGAIAYAHGTPVTGTATYLRILDASGNALVAAFTTAPGYNPSNTDNAALAAYLTAKGAAATVTVELTSARFENDRVTEGPFRAPSATFTLVP